MEKWIKMARAGHVVHGLGAGSHPPPHQSMLRPKLLLPGRQDSDRVLPPLRDTRTEFITSRTKWTMAALLFSLGL